MKFTTKLLSLAIASSAAIAPTAFAQSADLSITGRIFPGACTIELGNGGIADLGDIRADTLNEARVTIMPPVTLPMTVSCESEVRYAFQGTDNTSGSSTGSNGYGLGLTPADEKIGHALIMIPEATADSGMGYGTNSSDDGATWTTSNGSGSNHVTSSRLTGFAKSEGTNAGPDAIKQLQATLSVLAVIEPKENLTIDGDVPINGSATLNLFYL
ncbi:DUF1120 domain-containing protein [Stenotrophomonas bentonitica]|uniref:DUF1120 domain-containing protein n=1 Tax=Stenotrophomonas bentonitica TaxID=1450134 RepID=UPI00345E4CCD